MSTDYAKKAEWAKASMASASARLAKAAGEGAGYEDLAVTVNEIAKYEGAYAVYAYIAELQEAEVPKARLAHAVLSLAANGPDDRWSGRTNDAKRARYEGVLDAIRFYSLHDEA